MQRHIVQTSQVEQKNVLAIQSLEKFYHHKWFQFFSNVHETFISYFLTIISESEVEYFKVKHNITTNDITVFLLYNL